MGFPKGCRNARWINSKSFAKRFTYQSVALRYHLNAKVGWRYQATSHACTLPTPPESRLSVYAIREEAPAVSIVTGSSESVSGLKLHPLESSAFTAHYFANCRGACATVRS